MTEQRQFGGRHGRELAIGGCTALNPLGFSAYETWACRRAELTGYGESPFRMANGERATMAFVPTLEPTSFGGARMAVLLERTLAPLLERVAALGRHVRVGVGMALPERMNGKHAERRYAAERRSLEAQVLARASQLGLELSVNLQPRGHAGLAYALLWAALELEAERIDLGVVGGVDSYYDPDVMQALMQQERVFASGSLDAIIPGEAAAFALLGPSRTLRAERLPQLCRIETVALGSEPCPMGSKEPCLGLGLSEAALAAADRLRGERRTLDWILGDVTNEDYRGHEFQLAFPRFARDVVQREIPLEFLPMAMGDLGAATLPTALAIASEGFVRGDPAAKTCLLLSSSVGQERGAVLASAFEEEG